MLRLRPYKNTDAETIVQWLEDERTFRFWCADKYSRFPVSDVEMNDYYLARECIYPMTAEDDEGIAGHLTLRYENSELTDIRLGFVIVDPARRGRGYGRELVRLAAKYAFIFMGAEKVGLSVFENNTRAHACYLSAGFRDVTDRVYRPYTYKGEEWYCRNLEMDGDRAGKEGLIT